MKIEIEGRVVDSAWSYDESVGGDTLDMIVHTSRGVIRLTGMTEDEATAFKHQDVRITIEVTP